MPAEQARPLYLALDQGGHASRALVFDAHGVAQARSLREVQVHHPQADWVEQDPEELVASLLDAAREALFELGARATQVVAAGLATPRSRTLRSFRVPGPPRRSPATPPRP